MNKLCECPAAGFCSRHKVVKSEREHQLCSGQLCKPDQSQRYWTAWEKGLLNGHAPEQPKAFREGVELPPMRVSESGIAPTFPSIGGVGTELKKIIDWFKIQTSQCDACNARALIMDQKGIDWCEQNLDLILTWLEEGAAKRGVMGWLATKIPGFEFGARQVVLTAIENARKKVGPEGIFSLLIDSRLPPDLPPVPPVNLENAVRHLTFHLWPVSGNGIWKWHCDQLISNQHLLNGRRIISIATDDKSDSAEEVMSYLGDFTTEFIVQSNSGTLREVATWIKMLERLERYQSENDVTFSCHGKGVRRGQWSPEDSDPIYRWTKTMYDTCLNWPAVKQALEINGMAGSFRKQGPYTSKIWGPWHYSGTYYWWRNRDVFRRNWRHVPSTWFGTEAWPGFMFRHNETACLFADDIGNLYDRDYWNSVVEPLLDKWKTECLEQSL